jgi:hypothetical protein
MTHVAPMRAGDGNVRMHLAVQFFAAMSAG